MSSHGAYFGSFNNVVLHPEKDEEGFLNAHHEVVIEPMDAIRLVKVVLSS